MLNHTGNIPFCYPSSLLAESSGASQVALNSLLFQWNCHSSPMSLSTFIRSVDPKPYRQIFLPHYLSCLLSPLEKESFSEQSATSRGRPLSSHLSFYLHQTCYAWTTQVSFSSLAYHPCLLICLGTPSFPEQPALPGGCPFSCHLSVHLHWTCSSWNIETCWTWTTQTYRPITK